ncbi:MAG: glycosyltransferase, partial [Pseudomonadota bacterium]|nr:glycosyltransferase [Pseudomonadota bacterium]
MTRTLLIMAGGTGGHIMPGLAIAETMRARGWAVRWLGTAHGMENRLVPEAGIALHTIAFAGLRGKGFAHSLRGVGQFARGLFESLRFFTRLKPHAVLGMGGYVTVPGGLAAALTRIPLALMNSDSALLLSNRALKPFARRLLF